MTTEVVHSLFSPSRLVTLAKCPGWENDGKTSDAAIRGTVIGENIARYVTTGEMPSCDSTPEAYGVRAIASICLGHQINTGAGWIPEAPLKTTIPHVSGYADIVYRDMDYSLLVEIKSGYSDREPAVNNLQIIAYALGLLQEGYPEVYAYLIEVDKAVTSEAVFSQAEVPLMINQISDIIHTAENARQNGVGHSSPGNPGGHCRYCAHITTCPSMAFAPGYALQVIRERSDILNPKELAKSLSPEILGDTLRKVVPVADLIQDYVGALKCRAIEIIETGGDVPGWRVSNRNGKRTWIDEINVLHDLKAIVLDHDHYIQLISPVSPAQAEKVMISAGKKPSEAKKVIERLTKQGTSKVLKEQ